MNQVHCLCGWLVGFIAGMIHNESSTLIRVGE